MSKVPGDNWHGFLFVGDDPELFSAYEEATAQGSQDDDIDKAERRRQCWMLILERVHQALSSENGKRMARLHLASQKASHPPA